MKTVLFYRVIFFSFLIIFYSLAVIKPSSTILSSGLGWDKANHFIAFFILIISLHLAFKLSFRIKVILIGIFGIFIEFSQYFIESRSADIYDLLSDFIGIFSGVIFILIYKKYKKMNNE